ncbi:Uncharacterized protein QTN25_002564 [Entamoeba marina]
MQKDLREFYKTIPGLETKTDYIIDNTIEHLYQKYNYKVPFDVSMDCVYSHGKETPLSMSFETEDINGDYDVVYGDGDNLVNDVSLHSCSMFTDRVTDLGKHGHLLILNSKELFEHIEPLVCNNAD